ncbi:hypothetical protein PA10_00104 [Pseudomonas phage pPa_SNUABM_DT01]|nr:hypothetical protein PA10_00104 [Pseudomonas phage pPa_SNUABM_DT01]
MDKKQFVKDELKTLGETLLGLGYYFRLIMTDDIDSMTLIRERAKEKVSHASKKEWGQEFYNGLCIGDALQERVDALVRQYKPEVLALIKGSREELDQLGIEVIEDKQQKANLLIFSCCGMGFFISERIHKPRDQRARRTTMADVRHQALSTPPAKPAAAHKDQPVTRNKRRQFVTIRRIVN